MARTELMKRFFLMISCLISFAAAAASGVKPFVPAYTYEKYHITYQVRADGGYESTTEVQLKINTPQGIRSGGSQSVDYIASQDEVISIEAWTIQPDGTKVNVPESSIRTQDEQADESAAKFSDTKLKVIIFPNVETGSRVYYKARVNHHSPTYLGHFHDSTAFPTSTIWADVRIDYVFPSSMRIYEEKKGVSGGFQRGDGNFNYYSYRYSTDVAEPTQRGRVYVSDYSDRVSVSTFPDMVAIGQAYQDTAKPKARVTEDIQRLAIKLTDGLKDERSKVKRLYEWVATNIRYVSISLGNGRLIPHDAHEVLKNQYGDCKDHVVLLEALLDAVGVSSSPALINLGSAYKLSSVGVIQPLNHVITYIPSLDLYLDSTDQFTPFGLLIFEDMDKPTVLTALGKIGHTPRMNSKENVGKVQSKLKIDRNGVIHGTSSVTYQGVQEIDSRRNRFYEKSRSEQQVVKELLQRFNETGDGSMDFPDPERIEQPYWIRAKFFLNPVTNIPGRGGMMIPVGMAPGGIAWAGADQPLIKDFDHTCRSQTHQESYSIEFPKNVTIDGVPESIRFKNESVNYSATYTIKDQVVEVKRVLQIQHKRSVCGLEENKLWRSFHKVLQKDLRSQIFYK
jgi:transglutaminase-like putative cysteine protease